MFKKIATNRSLWYKGQVTAYLPHPGNPALEGKFCHCHLTRWEELLVRSAAKNQWTMQKCDCYSVIITGADVLTCKDNYSVRWRKEPSVRQSRQGYQSDVENELKVMKWSHRFSKQWTLNILDFRWWPPFGLYAFAASCSVTSKFLSRTSASFQEPASPGLPSCGPWCRTWSHPRHSSASSTPSWSSGGCWINTALARIPGTARCMVSSTSGSLCFPDDVHRNT